MKAPQSPESLIPSRAEVPTLLGEGRRGAGGDPKGCSQHTPNPRAALSPGAGRMGMLLWDLGDAPVGPWGCLGQQHQQGKLFRGIAGAREGRGCHTVPPALLLQDVPQDHLGPEQEELGVREAGEAQCQHRALARGSVPQQGQTPSPQSPEPLPSALLPEQDTTAQPIPHIDPSQAHLAQM